MKTRRTRPQSATSIGRAPTDDATSRLRTYLIMMGIRTLCVLLIFVVQPFGWHTAVFAIGGIFLPYIAVTLANVTQSGNVAQAERPVTPALDNTAPPAPSEPARPIIIPMTETKHKDEP